MRKFLFTLTLLASFGLLGCESDKETAEKQADDANAIIGEMNKLGSDLLYTHGVNVGDDNSVLPMSLDTVSEVDTVETKLKKYIAMGTKVIGISNRDDVEYAGVGRVIRYRDNAKRLLAQIRGARVAAQNKTRNTGGNGASTTTGSASFRTKVQNYQNTHTEMAQIIQDLVDENVAVFFGEADPQLLENFSKATIKTRFERGTSDSIKEQLERLVLLEDRRVSLMAELKATAPADQRSNILRIESESNRIYPESALNAEMLLEYLADLEAGLATAG